MKPAASNVVDAGSLHQIQDQRSTKRDLEYIQLSQDKALHGWIVDVIELEEDHQIDEFVLNSSLRAALLQNEDYPHLKIFVETQNFLEEVWLLTYFLVSSLYGLFCLNLLSFCSLLTCVNFVFCSI